MLVFFGTLHFRASHYDVNAEMVHDLPLAVIVVNSRPGDIARHGRFAYLPKLSFEPRRILWRSMFVLGMWS